MSIQEFVASPYGSVQELEEKIIQQIQDKTNLFFANTHHFVPTKSETGQKITSYVSQLVAQFPTSANGSRFIRAKITVCPKLVIRFSNLLTIREEERPGNLFHREIGKYIDVAPIAHRWFGNFTEMQERLELRDIHFPDSATFSKNDWTESRYLEERESIAINTTKTIGTVNINSGLQKVQLVASIRFGTYEETQTILDAETTDGISLDLIVPLPHLCKHGHIFPNGVAVFENGYSLNIEELIGSEVVTWIQTNYQLSLEYDLRK